MKLQLFKQTFTLPVLLGVTPQAEEFRNELAVASQAIKTVTTVEDQRKAGQIAVAIQGHIKSVQSLGLEFRSPLNDFVKRVKKTEDDHLAPLLAEKDRLSRLLADFDAQERKRVAEEERKRREEFDRAEAIRLEAEQKAQAAAFLAEQSGKKKDLKAAEKAQAEAVKAEATTQAVIAAPMPEKARASGVATRKVMKWKCVNVHEVYKSNAALVNLEPKASAINAVCVAKEGATETQPDTTSVPGLVLWWENKAVISSKF